MTKVTLQNLLGLSILTEKYIFFVVRLKKWHALQYANVNMCSSVNRLLYKAIQSFNIL